ncbi:MAG: endolytic transglycosylase MltG [Casimicrobiaceae bacterium]
MRYIAGLTLLALAVCAAAYWWAVARPLHLPPGGYALSVKPGATLRSVARDLTATDILPADWTLVALGRLTRADRAIKAGNYQIDAGTTLARLLAKLTQGDVTQSSIAIVEGWTFRDLKLALRNDTKIVKRVLDLSDAELMRSIGAAEEAPEGLFFPDTYFFADGSTDAALLARAYGTMHERLAAAWASRAPGLPLESAYEALTLASIVEKETGRAADRPLIAAVFINRLKLGMRLQTDPAVIYGIGERFDGNLRKSDLEKDHPFNTYVRAGLPPTPIALPGYAAIDAVLHPPDVPYLYFVARGDGSSEFSSNIADHNRAVAKYQRGGR